MDYCPIKSNFAVMKHPLDKFRYCPVCGSERFEVNNVKSKKCQACGFTYYMNPSAATVAVITKESGRGEGLLLVVRRGKEPAKGTLDLPGGFSDMGETSEEPVCVSRARSSSSRCPTATSIAAWKSRRWTCSTAVRLPTPTVHTPWTMLPT